jgi:hypothetical protein
MHRAFNQFQENLRPIKELDALYVYLTDVVRIPSDLSDLLRAQWVYAVSALDKLIHELIRIGMLEAFHGNRVRTSKFMAFGLSLDTHYAIVNTTPTTLPPAEYWFEQEIVNRHKALSFQDPVKIADGLSLVWDEKHKWQRIAVALSLSHEDLTTRLKNIVARRNQIVHESDLDLLNGQRNAISKADTDFVTTFIEQIATEIYNAIK